MYARTRPHSIKCNILWLLLNARPIKSCVIHTTHTHTDIYDEWKFSKATNRVHQHWAFKIRSLRCFDYGIACFSNFDLIPYAKRPTRHNGETTAKMRRFCCIVFHLFGWIRINERRHTIMILLLLLLFTTFVCQLQVNLSKSIFNSRKKQHHSRRILMENLLLINYFLPIWLSDASLNFGTIFPFHFKYMKCIETEPMFPFIP